MFAVQSRNLLGCGRYCTNRPCRFCCNRACVPDEGEVCMYTVTSTPRFVRLWGSTAAGGNFRRDSTSVYSRRSERLLCLSVRRVVIRYLSGIQCPFPTSPLITSDLILPNIRCRFAVRSTAVRRLEKLPMYCYSGNYFESSAWTMALILLNTVLYSFSCVAHKTAEADQILMPYVSHSSLNVVRL